MRLLPRLTPLIPLALLAAPALPCTAFLIAKGGAVLMGNNEDFWNHEVRIWFVPAEEGRYGRVVLGYENMYPQGGMNEKGLAFDGFATARYPMREQEGKEVFGGSLIDEVMATCATVDEVVALLERYDLRALESAMLMFADRSGDSVIVEGDEFLRKEGPFQVVTNFYQSRQEDDRGLCPRFDAAQEILGEAEEASLALCRRVLAATAQEGGAPTQYSNVFDLRRGRIHLYHFHNFEEVVVFDLAEELAKGARVLEIPSLFRPSFAYSRYVKKREREKAAEIDRRRGKPVEIEVLDRYAGRYRLQLPGAGEIVVVVRRDGRRLLASAKGSAVRDEDEETELIPETRTSFFYVDGDGATTIRFVTGEEGTPDRIVVTPPMGAEFQGERIE